MVLGTAAPLAGAAPPNTTSIPIARADVATTATSLRRKPLYRVDSRRVVEAGVTVASLGRTARADGGGSHRREGLTEIDHWRWFPAGVLGGGPSHSRRLGQFPRRRKNLLTAPCRNCHRPWSTMSAYTRILGP